MSVQTTSITAEEFSSWPEEPGMKQELIRGEVVLMPLPKPEHGAVAAEVARLLSNFVKPRRLGKVYGEVGVVTQNDPDSVRGPDVAFISNERLARVIDPRKFFRVAPDL